MSSQHRRRRARRRPAVRLTALRPLRPIARRFPRPAARSAARPAVRLAVPQSRYAITLLVPVALAALYGTAALALPDRSPERPHGTSAPVTAVLAVCPGGKGARIGVQTRPGGHPGGRGRLAGASTVTVGALGGAAPTQVTGELWTGDAPDGPVVVRADGPRAAGLTAEQTADTGDGDGRGLTAVRCTAPGTDQWFTGPGPASADRVEVLLANAETQPAAVDLTALSGDGPLDTTEGRGIQVDPGTSRVVRLGTSPDGLGDIVGVAHDLALRVHTTTGRVAAFVRVRTAPGKGVDWLPPAAEPAASAFVPGVPGGRGARRLLIAVPGDADAKVGVRVLTGDGAFTPAGQDAVDAPARTVTAVDLPMNGKAGAVVVTADRPVLTGFTAERGVDAAYGTAGAPLGPDGGLAAGDGATWWLALAAPGKAARVRLTGRANTVVTVPAGRVVETRVVPAAGLLVRPESGGPVYATRMISAGPNDELRFSVLPVVPQVLTTPLPSVRESVRVLLR
ncbi:hypothetical protein BTM25_13810 [Actinomadura rubteroloni]|uniref:Secreted protein n=1 Tax=Actinomadura rubteroloni TaxID=1926885 RepID=A0A2P4UPJ8_9ACTN|nr:DUF5719 family protein [Actinomadura rubteroloni]POM26973.1 hypothetical protein BTM25_13810 [Actinomadura rubteroloni]